AHFAFRPAPRVSNSVYTVAIGESLKSARNGRQNSERGRGSVNRRSMRLHTAARLPGAGAAGRADHARGGPQRVGDPGNVEHLRGRADARGGLLGNLAVSAPPARLAHLRD